MPDLFDLSDRVAIITGGAGVLGMVFARTLAERGAHIVIADVDQNRCDNCADEISQVSGRRALGIHTDVTEPNDVENLIRRANEEFGRIDILINNAAAGGHTKGYFTRHEEYSLNLWNQVMAVNLTAHFLTTRAVAPIMLRQKRGSIINIASIYGVVAPNQHIYEGETFNTPAIYSASKAGVLGLTRYLSTYWADKGIRVNAITPGGVFRGHTDPFLSNYCAHVPMGRMAQEDDLKGAILYLASDASGYVTGQNLLVDGGWTVW